MHACVVRYSSEVRFNRGITAPVHGYVEVLINRDKSFVKNGIVYHKLSGLAVFPSGKTGGVPCRTAKNGYPKVRSTNCSKIWFVHILIAEVFVENTYGKPIVNHIDGNKGNSSPENLEWVTHSENTIHAYKTGLCKKNRSKLTAKDVVLIRKSKDHSTVLSIRYGVSVRNIYLIKSGKTWC